MSSVGTWIELDQSALNAPIRQNIRGAEVEVMVAPQDFPEAIRCYFDENERNYVIEFKYVSSSNEPLVLGTSAKDVRFLVGQNSGRLQRVVISGDGNTRETIVAHLAEALRRTIEELSKMTTTTTTTMPPLSHRRPIVRVGNYRATRQVIDFKRSEIIDSFALAR